MQNLQRIDSELEYTKQVLHRKRLELARSSLVRFTALNNPAYISGWFQKVVSYYLEKFWRGEINLILAAPPRSGKTELASRNLPAWGFGQNPETQIIGCSYSDDLASRNNRDAQRIIDTDIYRELFPDVRINDLRRRSIEKDGEIIKSNSLRNSGLFEIVGHKGAYRSAGVGGGITGMGFDRGLIDDPIKDAKEAASETVRKAIWEWYTNVFYTRRSPGATICVMMTRWHENDLVGELIKNNTEQNGEKFTVVNLPAICENPNEIDAEVLEELKLSPRKVGDVLDEKRYDYNEINKTRVTIGDRRFNSLYQGNPSPPSGDIINADKFIIVKVLPDDITGWVRYWDKAATEGGTGAETSGLLLGKTRSNKFIVADVTSGRWGVPQREATIKRMAVQDGKETYVYVEQEPGSGGKESALSTIGNLAGYKIYADRVTGDKVLRAEPVSVQVDAGNVLILEGNWNQSFINQCRNFPFGLKDKVDSFSGAFNKIVGLDFSEAWFV